MTELLVVLSLIAGVVAAQEIGFWLGSLTRLAAEPFDRVALPTGVNVSGKASLALFGVNYRF